MSLTAKLLPHKHSYLQVLDITSVNESEKNAYFGQTLDNILSRFRIFDTALTIKNLPQTLDQAELTHTNFRRLKFFSSALTGILFFIILFVMSKVIPVWVYPIGIASGFFMGWVLPELYIKERIGFRQFLLFQAVPDFLEQLSMISSSTGFESFSQALTFIAPTFPGFLGEELRKLTFVQPFINEQELLDRLVQVCPHPLIKELVISIQLSSQFGGSLGEKVGQLVETAQEQREQSIKDLGNKTSGILLGPLLIFHLPALLVIFLIPFIFVLQKGL
jgi:Flp pilus assembly protein TadB